MNTKSKSKSKLLACAGLISLTAILTISSTRSFSAEHGGKTGMDRKMMDRCEAMASQRQKLRENLKTQDTSIREDVAAMNSASDEKKLGLLAALVTRMVEQRGAMDTRMENMRGDMMTHMMQHMEMGNESISHCPMMKQMKGMDAKSAEPNHDHREAK